MSTCLDELDVLALDCQATSADPSKGHLLEIGWSAVRASRRTSSVESTLLRLPDGASVPKRVQRITGLHHDALVLGATPKAAWSRVLEAARAVNDTTTGRCPAVIHFSRFEERHLRRLHAQTGPSCPFPFRIVCTHAVARRLLPELPRRGLRALAGYFGHPVSELRRSSHHVEATAAVWAAVVELLDIKENIHTLEELDAWLESRPPRTTSPRLSTLYPMPAKAREHLPDQPGVYTMLRAGGGVLYVGKATSLRQRVSSYFQKSSSHAEHILEMLTQARELTFTVTGSPLEAALEESDAIKKLSPPYNKALHTRDRALVFANRALSDFIDEPDRDHPIGPLPAGDLWTAISLNAELPPAAALAVAESYAPTEATFRTGRALYGETLGAESRLARGARLWREQLEDSEDDAEEEFQLKMQYDVGAERWSPASVAARLDEIVLRASHWVRRADWLCLLSESTLVWSETALAFENGRVHRRVERAEGDAVPAPRGYRKPFAERRSSFDLATYDRLSVLTRELRALVKDDRRVELYVSAQAPLDRAKLRTMLRWI